MQFVSILGALAILTAFAANQFGWIKPSQLPYAAANFAGASILTVVAVVDQQVGFIVMQGAWTLISAWSIVAILRHGNASARGARREED